VSDINTTWPLQAARDQLSQLVKAAAHAPQTVTVHGKPAAVVLSQQSYARLRALPAAVQPLGARGLRRLAMASPGLVNTRLGKWPVPAAQKTNPAKAGLSGVNPARGGIRTGRSRPMRLVRPPSWPWPSWSS
jgi:prevent-host-death family protein